MDDKDKKKKKKKFSFLEVLGMKRKDGANDSTIGGTVDVIQKRKKMLEALK